MFTWLVSPVLIFSAGHDALSFGCVFPPKKKPQTQKWNSELKIQPSALSLEPCTQTLAWNSHWRPYFYFIPDRFYLFLFFLHFLECVHLKICIWCYFISVARQMGTPPQERTSDHVDVEPSVPLLCPFNLKNAAQFWWKNWLHWFQLKVHPSPSSSSVVYLISLVQSNVFNSKGLTWKTLSSGACQDGWTSWKV